jgi:ABC-type bacteriocin/lantibiotic exporter with double-glycine peptidase domain
MLGGSEAKRRPENAAKAWSGRLSVLHPMCPANLWRGASFLCYLTLMLLSVPYFKQDTDYDCGHAVLQMLVAFFHKSWTLDEIRSMLHTNSQYGTDNRDLITGAEKLGFVVFAKENASLEDIRKYLKKGVPVVVNYIEPEGNVGHYAIVIGIEDKNIILNDPWHDAGFTLSLDNFNNRWRSGEEGEYTQWLMVATPQ